MLLNGSAMHDFKEYETHDFNMDILDDDKRDSIFNKQTTFVPKANRKYKVVKRVNQKDSDANEQIFSELGEEFDYKPWHIGGILSHPEFAHIKINIIYKNDIKVCYKCKEEALNDGYTNFNKGVINSKGIIYPFTGIRGDAKDLWRRVKILKTEKQVEFVKANTYPSQKQAIESSDVVIWACGYKSKHLPVYVKNSLSGENENLDFQKIGSYQYEVDDELRLIPKNSNKTYNIFGIGLGYSIKTTNKHVNAEKILNSRADGVRLYITIVPFILFKHL
jgi:hypothetical protein